MPIVRQARVRALHLVPPWLNKKRSRSVLLLADTQSLNCLAVFPFSCPVAVGYDANNSIPVLFRTGMAPRRCGKRQASQPPLAGTQALTAAKAGMKETLNLHKSEL